MVVDGFSAAIILKGLYQGLILGIELDQVPHAIRNCLILVHTCYGDLATLIDLRNEYLELLQSQPQILERMNRIISEARQALQEVCVLVEKCRPEAHGGKTPILSRLNWMFVDSSLFKQKEPIISRQHSAVIAELSFLRQLAFSNPMQAGSRIPGAAPGSGFGSGGGEGKWKSRPKRKTFTAADGQALRDMLGIDDELDPFSVPPTGSSLASQISNLSQGAASRPPPSYAATLTVHPRTGDIAGSFNALMGQHPNFPAAGQGMARNPGIYQPAGSGAMTNIPAASHTRLAQQGSIMNLRASTPNPGASGRKLFLSNELVQGMHLAQAGSHAQPLVSPPPQVPLQNAIEDQQRVGEIPQHSFQQIAPGIEQPPQLAGPQFGAQALAPTQQQASVPSLGLGLQHGQTMPTGGYGVMTAAEHAHYLRPAQSMMNLTGPGQQDLRGFEQAHGQTWGNPLGQQSLEQQLLHRTALTGHHEMANQAHISVTQGGIPYTIGITPTTQVAAAALGPPNFDKPLPTPPAEQIAPTQQPPPAYQPTTGQRPPFQQTPSLPALPARSPHSVQQPSPVENPPSPSQQHLPTQETHPVQHTIEAAVPKQPWTNPNHASRQRLASYNPSSGQQATQIPQARRTSQGQPPRAVRPPGTQLPRQQRSGQVQGSSNVPPAATSTRPASVSTGQNFASGTAEPVRQAQAVSWGLTSAPPIKQTLSPANIATAASIPSRVDLDTSRVSTPSTSHMAPQLTSSVMPSPEMSYQITGSSQSSTSSQWDAPLSSMPTGSSVFSDARQQMSPSFPSTPIPRSPPLSLHSPLGIHQLSGSEVSTPMERPPSSASVSSRGSVNMGLLHLDNPWAQPQVEVPPMERIAELPTENLMKYEVWEMMGDLRQTQTPTNNSEQVYEAPGQQTYGARQENVPSCDCEWNGSVCIKCGKYR